MHGATDMPAFDVAAANIMDLASRLYPAGTVFAGAMNSGDLPGTRRLAAVSKRGHVFAAPGNGLPTRVARDPGLQAAYRIQNQSLSSQPQKEVSANWVPK